MIINAVNFTSYRTNILKSSPTLRNIPVQIQQDTVSFSGVKDLALKLEVKKVEKDAYDMHKEASEIRQDSRIICRNAAKIQKEALISIADGDVLFNEVQKILNVARKQGFPNQYDKATGELTREFYDGDDGQFIMEEYDEKNRTIRKTIISSEVTMVIKTNPMTGKNDSYCFDTLNGELLEHSRGLKIKGDGYSADENFSYCEGELLAYDKNYKIIPNEIEKSYEHFVYENNKLIRYICEWQKTDDVEKASEDRFFENEILTKALSNTRVEANGNQEAEEEYIYEQDGGIDTCSRGVEFDSKTNKTTAKARFEFNDDGLYRIYYDHAKDAKGVITAKKAYLCEDDTLKKRAINYKCSKNNKEEYESIIEIK